MKLSEFIVELQKIENAQPGKDVQFFIRYLAGDSELREEIRLLEMERHAITFESAAGGGN